MRDIKFYTLIALGIVGFVAIMSWSVISLDRELKTGPVTTLCMIIGNQAMKAEVSKVGMLKLGVDKGSSIEIITCDKETELEEIPELILTAKKAMGFDE